MTGEIERIAAEVERLGERGDNSLDVRCEVALFKPGTCYTAIRANNAGTKVIYTDRAGNDVTCWAEDWTIAKHRASTLTALRAHLEQHHAKD